ncbi:chemotaxis protein CheY [Thermoplasmatales archaeon ex4572_165]|nr:MAG: chemotaxis protein CheY [Thermoplasmatales archaeon ex4572_165]RLF57751.1 MAG: response regulator [Thermoplasmata archaeon]
MKDTSKPKRIMMVDDKKDQCSSISIALNDKYGDDYIFISADSGKKCLLLLKESEELPDIIILDLMMPEMSGWEVFDKIRDNPDWRQIPIIFLTARTDRIAETAGEFFGNDFLQKPIGIEDLIKRIDKVLNKKK